MSSQAANAAPSDEELVVRLGQGQQEALGALYSRYAGLVFHLANHSLGASAAEEMVQEVFLAVWRSASSFDPGQSTFRPWLLRLTHWRIMNELRRRGRRPREQDAGATDQDDPVSQLADADAGPEERAWRLEQGELIRSALAALPPKQRQAVALAFLDDLTHEQVARTLDVPVGTAKTRIRSGLAQLRLRLAPVAASLLLLGGVVVGVLYAQARAAYERDERALSLVTISELVPLRLTPASPAVPAAAHANYRGRAGNSLAVLTVEALPASPGGRTYQAWARQGDVWTSLGTFAPESDGTARLIAENPALATPPEALEVTVEPTGGSATPSSAVALAWPGQ